MVKSMRINNWSVSDGRSKYVRKQQQLQIYNWNLKILISLLFVFFNFWNPWKSFQRFSSRFLNTHTHTNILYSYHIYNNIHTLNVNVRETEARILVVVVLSNDSVYTPWNYFGIVVKQQTQIIIATTSHEKMYRKIKKF